MKNIKLKEPIYSFTIQELLDNRDGNFIHHDQHTEELESPVLEYCYANTAKFKIKSSKFGQKVKLKNGQTGTNRTWYNVYVLFEDFYCIGKDKDIDFIICAAGGEFLVECLPYVDFDIIKNNPKFMAGFSDPTGLLFPITTKLDIATIYGSNFGSFGEEKFYKCHYDFLDTIKGDLKEISSYDLYENERAEKITGLEGLNLTEKVEWKTLDNKDVKVEGRIIGGCFDLINELIGTKYDGIPEFNEKYKNDGIIWYFDNCELSMEETIRVLWKMNECDYFKYAKAIIFGRFGVETSYLEYNPKTCLKDSILSKLNIPVIYDADVSHKGPSIPIINGSIAHINYSKGKAKISYELK